MINSKLFTHRWICVLPLVVLLIFIGFYLIAQLLFVECKATRLVKCERIAVTSLLPAVQSPPPVAEASANISLLETQYTGRMTWLFVASTNALVCLFAIGIFGLIGERWLGARLTAGLIALAFVLGGVVATVDTLPFVGPLYNGTIEASNTAGIKNFLFVNRLIHLLAAAATFAMVFVVCAIVFGSDKGVTRSTVQSDSVELLSEKRNQLKIVLYVSAILLIIGVLRADQTSTWAISFISDANSAPVVKAFFRTVTASLGGFYTLLLAAVYIPAAFVIHERARIALRGEKGAETKVDVNAKLEEHGFKFSFAESFPRILAIAAPLLTGPIAELLKSLPDTAP